MAILGSLGNFYVVLLFLFLIGGSALIAFNLSKGFWEKSHQFIDKKGGKFMNKWIKLAITSFAGILIASFALGITSNLPGQDASSAHSSHGTDQMAGGQMSMPQGQMSGINGMNGIYGIHGQMGNGQMYGYYDINLYQLQMNMMQLQQQLNRIQMQINQSMNPGMGNMGNMNNMNNMNGMSNMNNMNSNSMSGGMGMM